MSSKIPKLNAAEYPISDQSNGIIKTYLGILVSVNRNSPSVKIVVGQGSPNVGADG